MCSHGYDWCDLRYVHLGMSTEKETKWLALINRKGWAVAQDLQELLGAKDVSLKDLGQLVQKGPKLTPEEKLRAFLEQINQARTRLESGKFGYCLSCSAAFTDGQLDEMPWVELCHVCDGSESFSHS